MYVLTIFFTSIICRLQFETEEMMVFCFWSGIFQSVLEPYVSMNLCLFVCVQRVVYSK